MTAAQPHIPDEIDDEDDARDEWPWVLTAAAASALAIAVPYWMADYPDIADDGIGTYAVLVISVVGVASLLLSAFHLGSKLETAIALCIPAPVAVMGRVLIDTADDPSSHNLWPLELAVAVGISVPPVLIGILVGWAARRALGLERRAPSEF